IRTGTPRQPAMQTRNTIFTMTMPFVIIPSQASESSGEAICKPCEVTIPASRQVSTSGEFSERVISGSRNTQSHTRGASIHSEYYGVPQRKGRARDTVFRGSLRGARLEEPMGSADRVTPHQRNLLFPRSRI